MISDPPRLLRYALAALVLLALQGCANRLADAQDRAASAGFQHREIDAAPFRLTAFVRMRNPPDPVTVYIEGDGAAWLSPTEASPNPTPRHALALRLAMLDPSPNIVYLARPCQFTPHDPACTPAYWTNRRFSEEVVASMNSAITQIVGANKWRKINLVGYSGGGAIAALIAARRQDVESLRTIAGNLDPGALNAYHHVSPMTGSLDPIDIAPSIATIPQEHFVGMEDSVVPLFVSTVFVAAQNRAPPHAACARITRVPQASHEEGWEDFWTARARETPLCR